MTPTRRDLFKIAAGLGLAGTMPTAAERIAAMEALNHRVHASPTLDPATFADEAEGAASEHLGNDWWCAVNAEVDAEWKRKRETLLDAMPELRNVRHDHPFTEFEEASFGFAQIAYHAGIKHGAAFEHLRRTVIGDLSECRTCWGVGLTKAGSTCRSCGGTGMVVTGTQLGHIGGG